MVSNSETEITEPCPKKAKENNNDDCTDETNAESNISKSKNLGETPANPLSKNQLKKQRKLANYEEFKKERRLRERARMKQKREEALAKGLPTRVGPSRKELKRKQQLANKEGNAGFHIAIDLDYDDLMHDKDVAKCVKQCLRIYTINRRSSRPVQIHFTGIKQDGRIHNTLKKNDGYENWNVKYYFGASYNDVFTKDNIIYLTSESDDVLEVLEEDKFYIIGGLVDHNHQKGLCHQRASEAGLKTARLPLNEHVDMKTRTVLSTYHVFEILMRVSEGNSWTDAILNTIPLRKGAKPKLNSPNVTPDNQYLKQTTDITTKDDTSENNNNNANEKATVDTKKIEES